MGSGTTLLLLAISTLSSLVVALGAVLVLHPEERISVWRGFTLTALGAVFFPSLFEWLNALGLQTVPGRRFCKRYKLSPALVLDINNKVVSAVQALFCVVTGVVVCGYSCTRDLLHTSHFASEAYAWFGAAYFFYDIWSMYKVHILMHSDDAKPAALKQTALTSSDTTPSNGKPPRKLSPTFLAYCLNEPVIIFHHLFIGGFGFLVIVYLRGGLGDCVFGFVYLMELSTPFVSARGILSRLGLKSSDLYVWNGLAMLLTFFVCRVASLPYTMLLYSRVVDMSYWQAMQSLPTGCKVSIAILLLPQLYWFYLMSTGAVKVLLVPKRPPKQIVECIDNDRKRS